MSVLACDIGGTSLRAALLDDAGTTLAEAATASPQGDEVDADDWWRGLLETAAALARQDPAAFAATRGIAICGVTRTQVFLGRDGSLLRPAITWRDARAEHAATRLGTRLGSHPEAPAVNAYHPAARLAWLAEAEPASAAALATVLEPKDYLNFRLTGRRATDPISMARLVATIDTLPDPGILPPRHHPTDVIGPIAPGLPAPFDQLAGLPVFCGCNDTWTAVLGLGALRPGLAYNISGTTEVLGVLSATPANAEGLLTVDWGGLHQLGGPSQNGADCATWLASLLQAGPDALLRQLRGKPLLFLPYLQGERVPHWDPHLRGAFLGLDRQHGPVDLAWAVLEGVAFQNRLVLERAEAAIGTPVREIRFGGGGAGNPAWRQVKADICRRPVLTGTAREPGLLGAAILAWTGLHRFPSLAAAQDSLVHIATRHTPDPARILTYDALYRLFRDAESAVAPISHGLAALAPFPPP